MSPASKVLAVTAAVALMAAAALSAGSPPKLEFGSYSTTPVIVSQDEKGIVTRIDILNLPPDTIVNVNGVRVHPRQEKRK